MNLSNAVEFYSCLIAIMNHYGYDHQVYEKLPEEVDVHIMLEQFQMLITSEDKKEFDKICMDKLHREVGRIEAGGTK